MVSFDSRPFEPRDLPELLALIDACARSRWPECAYLLTSDFGWQDGPSASGENLRPWRDDVGLAAWAWFEPPTLLRFDVRADVPLEGPLGAELLTWGEARRRSFAPGRPRFADVRSMAEWEQELRAPQARDDRAFVLETTAFERDAARNAWLAHAGFAPCAHHAVFLRRSLAEPAPACPLPAGARVRHVEPRDFAERVATHCDAWSPGSSFGLAEYQRVRALDGFEPELDLVLELGDGTFAGYCIAWVERALEIGSFEPVGTRRGWRGRGVARAVTCEGLRRLAARGLHTAVVQTAGFNERAQALYRSCGFAQVGVLRTWLKTLP